MDLSLDYHFRNRFRKEHERGVYRILVNEQYAVCSWAVHKSNSKVLIREEEELGCRIWLAGREMSDTNFSIQSE